MSVQNYVRFPSGATYYPVRAHVSEPIAFGAPPVTIAVRNLTGTYLTLLAVQGYNSQNDGGGTLDVQNVGGSMLTTPILLPPAGGLAVGTINPNNHRVLNGQDISFQFTNPVSGGGIAMTDAQASADFAVHLQST